MDQGNLAILVDAKFEYTKQLINILKNNLFQGIKKIYNDAKEYSIEHDELDKVLKKFVAFDQSLRVRFAKCLSFI